MKLQITSKQNVSTHTCSPSLHLCRDPGPPGAHLHMLSAEHGGTTGKKETLGPPTNNEPA